MQQMARGCSLSQNSPKGFCVGKVNPNKNSLNYFFITNLNYLLCRYIEYNIYLRAQIKLVTI